MPTQTATAPDTSAADGAVDTTPGYADRVAALAEKFHKNLVKGERKKRPADRAKDKDLWSEARKAAAAEVRRQMVKETAGRIARNAATTVYAEVKSVAHRNRRQLAPWQLASPYALLGEVMNLIAEYGHGSPIGMALVCAVVTTLVSFVLWRKKITKRTSARFAPKVQAGMSLACIWTALMPLIHGPAEWGMWLAWLASTAWLSLSWWREHDHPIPLPADLADLDVTEVADLPDSTGDTARTSEPTAAQLAFADQLLADWIEFVVGQGTLPGSTLTDPTHIEYGWTFLLHLVRGKQTINDVRAAKAKIAAALNIEEDTISVDRLPASRDQSTVVLTVVTDPVTNTYDGPRIVREGENIYIEIGPYEDGIGAERFHVLAGQLTAAQLAAGEKPRGSMNGGFVLGTKGSGKSRLMEEIADGLRELGIELWYLDPQMGKSSPALMAEADWPLAGMHGTGGSFSNVADLWKAVKAVNRLRSNEGAAAGDQGFQHTRKRPSIMVMIDECHGVFQAENPLTGNSFGADFADEDREMRKNGLALFGASQSITQDTFGTGNKAAVLRDGMCAVNVYVMSYGGKNLGLVPGYDQQPAASLPTNRGYGYSPKGERAHTRWQARYTENFQPWLSANPKATLDERAQKVIGDTYLKRFEKYEADSATAQALLDDIDARDGDASDLLDQQVKASKDTKPATGGGAVVALMSPAQRRMHAAGVQAPATTSTAPAPPTAPSGPASTAPEPAADQDLAALTDTERQVLDIVKDTPHNPTSLGKYLGITSQSAGQHLRNLAAKGWAARMDDGRYTAKV